MSTKAAHKMLNTGFYFDDLDFFVVDFDTGCLMQCLLWKLTFGTWKLSKSKHHSR